jgi:N-methylhydantoinase A/oxoprolinase/acetone carboxylase beta subunit
MVEAVDVYTLGLGGDSHVQCDDEKQIHIGPKRVIPLCKLVDEHPPVLQEMSRLAEVRSLYPGIDQFLILGRQNNQRISNKDAVLINLLKKKPQSLAMLVSKTLRDDPWLMNRLQAMEATGTVQRAGFTPTDALHVLKRFQLWDRAASQVGAQLLSDQLGMGSTEFCEKVVQGVSTQLAASVVTKVLEDRVGPPDWRAEPTARTLLDWALNENHAGQLDCRMTLDHPIVAMGAPVAAYMPKSADKLHTQLFIPQHAAVANAIGAASGGVVQRLLVHIRPLAGGSMLRLHLPQGSKDFVDLQQAVNYASKCMGPLVESQARQAGAKQVEIKMDRSDKRAKARGQDDIYLGTELAFVAIGRPSIAR